PISFLGALFLLPALDVSISMVSLFAFILALGILVDDAIVVGENIFVHCQMGKPYLQAAIDGVLEVSVPVTFSILTTIAALMPMLFIADSLGKFMKVVPLVVISFMDFVAGGQSTVGSHLSDIALFLTESEERNFPASEITERWRQKVGEVLGAESLTFTSDVFQIGADIDIQMAHRKADLLEKLAEKIKTVLSDYPGVEDIKDNYTRGKQELKLKLKPEARTLGVTEKDLARQVRAAFYGAEAIRLQIGRNEVKVMVRYPEQDRKNLWEFETMRIRTPDGGEIPLNRAAKVLEGRGFSEINRTDRKRMINVTASVDSTKANAAEILSDLKQGILTDLANDYPGLVFDLVGEEKERREVMGSMKDGFLLALFAI
ncbi:MAG: efflux RND transporter permease subunit, partial [Deltaproteobacteria bacterium]|nr:efflux RND transporter permease subunit [Deltaproteobacteria bacterium]